MSDEDSQIYNRIKSMTDELFQYTQSIMTFTLLGQDRMAARMREEAHQQLDEILNDMVRIGKKTKKQLKNDDED